ncbi:HNH endonuclease [Pseudomonas sp. GM25]|uniref:HNH endonuclease n=1 Tax=Pseudomonas sp. GM25 TaxID=1144327 RepID=UPI0002703E7A|nr:HNH endonuclease [Pseudomonas sp. GM25]EJM31480.1 putative restriction endonuclease [Pseudomonas sp. GM25]
MSDKKKDTDWTVAEIEAAVDAYLKMFELERIGQKFNKAHENRLLRASALHNRTEGSVEFRMQNISAVLLRMHREYIKGYKPARNVGSNVEPAIRAVLIAKGVTLGDPTIATADEEALEQRALALEKLPLEDEPEGIVKPKRAPAQSTVFIRDPKVRAWVRQKAKGICEGCGEPAPFTKNDSPYLEVHHVRHLANKGSDRISNAVALCPNCHRRCHHSNDSKEFTESLYDRVKRLKREHPNRKTI